MYPSFLHTDLQQTYEKMGFVIVDLFSQETATKILAFYDEMNAEANQGFHSTLHHRSNAYRRKVMNEILLYVQEPLSQILMNHQIITCSFVVKEADPNSRVIMHQDWNLTNEQTYPGFNVWVSLTDTDVKNGALHLLPGSHQLPFSERGTGLPDPCKNVQDIPLNRLFCAATKAGQAVIYDVRTLHASPPNLSAVRRVACAIGSVSKDADMLHLHYNPDKKTLTTYQVSSDFFIDYTADPSFFDQLPISRQETKQPHEFTHINPADVERLLKQPSLLQKWSRFFAK